MSLGEKAFDGVGLCEGECGDTIMMGVMLRNNRITSVRFQTDGCRVTSAAAWSAASLAEGKSLSEALRLSAIDVIEKLGGLPEDHEHCAVIAVNALHEAVTDAVRNGREPWRRLYR
jgi:nitrogen fixation protein NifU and related proteins